MQSQIDDLQAQLKSSIKNGDVQSSSAVNGTPQNQPLSSDTPASFGTLQSSTSSQQHIRRRFSKEAQFAGSSSIQYGLDVGRSSLKSIGVQPDEGIESTVPNSAYNTRANSPVPGLRRDQGKPLERISYEEGLRLIQYYEEELYPIYPLLNASHTGQVAKCLLKTKNGSDANAGGPEIRYDDRDVDVLRMVLATSLILEGQGQDDLAEQMAGEVQESVSKRNWAMPVDMRDVLIQAMMSVYFFQCDEEVMAWRVIGTAVRLAQEMGLHRHKTLLRMFQQEHERLFAIKLFWSIYVLDQRWSLGSGLPCALNQEDIDPELPEPEDSSPYSKCLISYARLSSKVMKYVDNSANLSVKERKEEAGYLDFQLQQWQHAISPELQLIHPSVEQMADKQPRNLQRLRTLLYARCNHLRIVNRRHYLLSASNISDNLSDAKFVVDTAKDTIQVLAHCNRTSNIYQMQQSLFNYFLISALAALFLAVCHGPTYFSETCRAEFMLALDLVKGFSSKSLVSRRLWKTVRELRLLAPKLGLTPGAETGASSGMPSLTSQQMGAVMADSMVPGQNWMVDTVWSQNDDLDWMGTQDMGSQMSFALTDLFDAMGAAGIVAPPPAGDGFGADVF